MDTLFMQATKNDRNFRTLTTTALLKQIAEVGDGDYGEAVQGSTVADESPASSEPNQAEPWFI